MEHPSLKRLTFLPNALTGLLTSLLSKTMPKRAPTRLPRRRSSPLVDSLHGVLKGTAIGKAEFRRHQQDKYGIRCDPRKS